MSKLSGTRRYLALFFPWLPAERFTRSAPKPPDLPLVFTEKQRGALRLASVDARAQALGLRTGMPLAEEDETLAIIPAAYGTGVIDHMLDEFDTLILLKVKPLLDEVLELLERRALLATSCFIEKVGSPDERIVRDVASLKDGPVNYLSLLLVQNPKRQRGELRRGCRQRALEASVG